DAETPPGLEWGCSRPHCKFFRPTVVDPAPGGVIQEEGRKGRMGCDDAELIARWRRGDRTAFEALVRRWQQPIGRFLFRLTGRADTAGDLCQEVFLRPCP